MIQNDEQKTLRELREIVEALREEIKAMREELDHLFAPTSGSAESFLLPQIPISNVEPVPIKPTITNKPTITKWKYDSKK